MVGHSALETPIGQVIRASRKTLSTNTLAVRTKRLTIEAITASTKPPNRLTPAIRNQVLSVYFHWSRATGTVWAPKASPKNATDRDATISISARLIGRRAGRG